jgi:hypothetical protein
LIQDVVCAGNAGPTARIRGNTKDDLFSGDASLKIRANCVVDLKILGVVWILLIVEEGRRMIGGSLPRAVEVVALQVEEVQLLRDFV